MHTQQRGRRGLFVEQNYTYFLYLMAASSRGKYPPKFNGMVFNTGGDFRSWGAQHWFANLSCYYEALFATNRFELMDPMFDMYSGHAARLQRGRAAAVGQPGHVHPRDRLTSTAWRNCRTISPPKCARSTCCRSRGSSARRDFMELAQTKLPHSSRWNWIESGSWVNGRWVIKERGFGPYGAVTHILGSNGQDRLLVSGGATNSRTIANGSRSALTPCCAARWSSTATSPT